MNEFGTMLRAGRAASCMSGLTPTVGFEPTRSLPGEGAGALPTELRRLPDGPYAHR